jgi:hypothetical protein
MAESEQCMSIYNLKIYKIVKLDSQNKAYNTYKSLSILIKQIQVIYLVY